MADDQQTTRVFGLLEVSGHRAVPPNQLKLFKHASSLLKRVVKKRTYVTLRPDKTQK